MVAYLWHGFSCAFKALSQITNRGIIISTSYEKHQRLAVFDLDNTLLDGDSDYAWTQFLVERGYLDGDFFLQLGKRFQSDYIKGALDLDEYIAFVSKPIQRLWPDTLADVQAEYLHKVRAMMLPAAMDIIAQHKQRGDYTMIMTATNNLVASGICKAFAVDSWMATMLEIDHSGFTGRIQGVPCFREGKRTLLTRWLHERNQFSLARTWFYSDSHNDLPLLNAVAMPVAVAPDATLRDHARQHGWPIISFHNSQSIRMPYEQDAMQTT